MAISDKIDKNKDFANGAIVRVKLEDFITYDSLEFFPGANLNVVIGPNGTGKSTLVCAICLGMTGKPSVLGRASSLSDFIKYGKNKATIEIELNEWFVNEKSVKLKDIEDLVNSLNIQVGNLCQFLPQEKVSEFARMNPQELLENTEKAVGGLDLFEKHTELKEQSKRTKELERELGIVEESLKKEEATNNRLEGQVKAFVEKRKQEESILWLKRKQAVLTYKEKFHHLAKLRLDHAQFKSQYDALVAEFEPIKEKKDAIEKKLSKQKQIIETKNGLIKEKSRYNKDIEIKLDDFNEKMSELKSDYTLKETEFKNHKTKVKQLQSEIETLKREYDEAKEGLNEIKEQEAEIKTKQDLIHKERDKILQTEYALRNEQQKLKSDIEAVQKQINDMKNVRKEKLTKLKQNRGVEDAFRAIEWLDKNREMFKGIVYEPMFLLINIKDQKYTKYVENTVPFKDLVSMFLFEDKNDLNIFVKRVREELKLAVHTALVPNKTVDSFNPYRSINELKKFGFSSYLREQIEAPDAVLVYLCLYQQIHQLPVGNTETHKNIKDILPQVPEISRCYTSTHQYISTKSRYTGKISSQSSEVSQSFWLTSSVNQADLKNKEDELIRIKSKLTEVDEKIKTSNGEKINFDRQLDALKSELNKLKERRLYVENIGKKLSLKQTALKTTELQNIDLLTEAKKKIIKMNDLAKKKVKIFTDCVEYAKALAVLNKDKISAVYQEAVLQAEKMRIQTLEREYTAKKQELESNHENYQANLEKASVAAHKALEEANVINNLPRDSKKKLQELTNSDEYRTHFMKYPDTIEQLEMDIAQAEAIQQCSSSVDENVIKDFEIRAKRIEELRREFEKKNQKLTNHQNNYENTKNEWMGQVEEMISTINSKFSDLFKLLKCAGEISLGRPDNLEDFSRYGICIKVSFRNEEKLQELTAWQQSGGEKSVSTMMYMIALQEMTKCPFRVVDEINQGMDPVNERKVFDIIVQNSCSKQFAQYFLLTPKLLPDLSFDDKTNVICVFNGPHNLKHSSYNLKQFITRRKQLD